MSISNTSILIKRSLTNDKPSSLLAGEFAYSYSSNTLFMGSPTGDGVVNVGGVFYTQTLDSATSSNTASTLVKRDANGQFSGRLDGIAGKADQLTNARNFSISGHDITAAAVSFDGTGAVVLDASLNVVPSLGAGVYGSTTEIPVITVAANGRVMNVTTSAISADLSFAGDSGTGSVNLLTGTFNLDGGDGITSSASGDTVTFDVDNTVVRANTPITLQTIDSSVSISGNLSVLGTQFITNTTTLNIADPLIYLASNNYYSDIVDIGFAGNYFDGVDERHTGVFRNAGNKEYYIFDNYLPEISSNNEIDVADASFRVANLHANLVSQFADVTNAYLTNATITTANITNLSVTGTSYVADIISGAGNSANTGTYKFAGSKASISSTGNITLTPDSTDPLNGVQFAGNAYLLGPDGARNAQLNYGSVSGQLGVYRANIYGDFASTSTTSGSLIVTGGAGVSGNLYVGGNLVVQQDLVIDDLTADVITANTLNLTNALTVPNGGTGQVSFNSGEILIGSGTNGLTQLANVSSINTSLTANSTVSNLTTDVWGRVTGFTTQAISGLTVGQGGTGLSTVTLNGMVYGSGSGALGVTAAAGDADQTWSNQIMTVTNLGTPVWSTALDGGQF